MDRRKYSELQIFLFFQELSPWTQGPSEGQLWLLRGCTPKAGDSHRAPGPASMHQTHACRVAISGGPATWSSCQNLQKPAFSASILGGKIFQEMSKWRLFAVPGKNEGLNLGTWRWLNHLDSLGRCHQLKQTERVPHDHFNHLFWQEDLK